MKYFMHSFKLLLIILNFTAVNAYANQDNREIEFQKEIKPKYTNYDEYRNYVNESQMGQLANINPLFKLQKDTLLECGNKYKHLKQRDFILATQDCLYKWKVYYHYESCKEDKICDDVFDFKLKKQLKKKIDTERFKKDYKLK